MESSFIDFLNSFGDGFPLGTVLAIILGGASIITGIIIGIKKVKKIYDNNVAKRAIKEREEIEFRQSIENLAQQVSSIKSSLSELKDIQNNSNIELNEKIQTLWNSVTESQKDSEDSDSILESEITNYEQIITNMSLQITNMDKKITLFLESDKEGIKSFIVDKYYQAMKDEYIEMYVLESLELRYEKYLQEDGDTYVEGLMKQIRELPHKPVF